MRRLTTPTHRFELDLTADELATVAKAMITYAQDGTVILNKSGDEVTIENGCAVTKLTQEDTQKFYQDRRVEMQVRCLTLGGEALASNIMTDDCDRVLNDEVMT